MKKIFFHLSILLVFCSCNSYKEKEITQAEFKQLLTTDSVSSICVNRDDACVRILKKGNENKPYLLKMESSAKFDSLLTSSMDTLAVKCHIHPIINKISYVGSTIRSRSKMFDMSNYWWGILILPFLLFFYYYIKGRKTD